MSLSSNPNITSEIMELYSNHNWDFEIASENPNITLDFINNNIESIDFFSLSMNTFGTC